ncbi:MAG: hypothetical protein COA58_02745 [Bacteroidetes bacterium]|nr:MAG: hypothetical protein COA58_02745 [Bacteroidota bacterium]
MEKRVQIEVAEPAAYNGMMALEKYLHESHLNKSHLDLVKIRASQLNRCAYCIDMHTKNALKNGEDIQRIFMLNAWRETGLFTEEEKIILQITEEVTLIHIAGLASETYQKAIEILGENTFSQIIMAITTINAWNRIAVSTHKPISGGL